MKIPFARKRDAIGKPLVQTNDFSMAESSGVNSEYAVHMQSNLAARTSFHRDREIDEPKRKSMSDRLKQLNCAASKNMNMEDNMMMYGTPTSARQRDPSNSAWSWQSQESSPEITRPVLITVKDGDMPYVTRSNEPRMIELKNSFVVGKPPQRSKSSDRLKVSFGRQSSPKSARGSFGSPSSGISGFRNPMRRAGSKDMNDMVTAQEMARKARWRKGLVQSWRDDSDMPSLVSDNGDASTASRSVMTGYDSNSVHTEYTTDATNSDESADYSPRRRLANGTYRTSPPRIQSFRTGHRSQTGLWAGVAEDMGIIAGMLLADGAACMGGVAAITGETVTSCRPQR